MSARVWLMALSFLLLSGCLVTFKDPIPARDAAPAELLGRWTSKNAWGEALELEITRAAGQEREYKAVSYRKGDRKHGDEYTFTVSRHGSRWYLSAGLPDKYGSNYVIAGFELSENNELVVYPLDIDRINQLIEQKTLAGQALETEKGDGVMVTSPLDQVFAYLDDPANSDVFLEMARYQRLPK
ncbi:hypothetical protein [Pseudomonas sp. NA-150]|uniref:hypothetical protein n=1 Tax=Pseudomonas sp. NA-150 TaxID=3367525 RepID=UPI0037CC45B0